MDFEGEMQDKLIQLRRMKLERFIKTYYLRHLLRIKVTNKRLKKLI